MSEITASFIHSPNDPNSRPLPELTGDILRINEAVTQFLEANQLNADDVLFAGYSPQRQKVEGSEHWEEGQLPQFFFGDLKSLHPPRHITDDIDKQGEHWVVNPLMYAIEHGSLGIYDRHTLEENGKLESGQDDIDEFGTFAYAIDPKSVEQAKIATISFRG